MTPKEKIGTVALIFLVILYGSIAAFLIFPVVTFDAAHSVWSVVASSLTWKIAVGIFVGGFALFLVLKRQMT
jgi:type III secretory pathway component EscU